MKTRFSLAYVFTYVCILCIVGCSREDNGLHGRADAGEQIKFTATMGSTSAATKAPATSFRISDTRFSGDIVTVTGSNIGHERLDWADGDKITIIQKGDNPGASGSSSSGSSNPSNPSGGSSNATALSSDYKVSIDGTNSANATLTLAAGNGHQWRSGETNSFVALYPSATELGITNPFIPNATSYVASFSGDYDVMPSTQYCTLKGPRDYRNGGTTTTETWYAPDMSYAYMAACANVSASSIGEPVELSFHPQFSSVEVKLVKPSDMSGSTVNLVKAVLTGGNGDPAEASLSGSPSMTLEKTSGLRTNVSDNSGNTTGIAYPSISYAYSSATTGNSVTVEFKDSESAAETSSPELNESTPLSFTFLLLPVDVTQLELELTLDIGGITETMTMKLKDAQGNWIELPAGKKLTISNAETWEDEVVTPSTPLTILTTEDNTTITINNINNLTFKYSIGGGALQTSNATPTITISVPKAGQKVRLYQESATAIGYQAPTSSPIIGFDRECYVYGNIMSLCSEQTSFATATAIPSINQFMGLFYENANLRFHPTRELLLPATTLKNNCYVGMFEGCTGLTSLPSGLLPATTLALSCYESMFNGCTGLTSIPSGLLPAETLAPYCYNTMFASTGIAEIPSGLLPAETLAPYCYTSMFFDCTVITKIPSGLLPATTLAESCYGGMFAYCTGTSLPNGFTLPATTLAPSCYDSMFEGCTSLQTAPALPATTLATSCYRYMFQGCSSLQTAPALPATTLANYCYSSMFYGCSNLNYIECMATDMSATGCLTNWVRNVAPTGTFVKHPNAKVAATAAADTWAENSENGIPPGWTIAVPITVSYGKKVAFSPGNLQAVIAEGHDDSAEGARWQFADRQYQYPSRANGGTYSAAAGTTVDLFRHSDNSGTHAFGIPVNFSSTTSFTFVDWGQNEIYPNSSASTPYSANTYRTLTKDEWKYLLRERTGAQAGTVGSNINCCYSMVTVEGVYGMIIYPDGFVWEASMGTAPTSFNTASSSSDTYTGTYWCALEAAGVVFLPAAGYYDSKNGKFDHVGFGGLYWSATVDIYISSNDAYYLGFSSGGEGVESVYRFWGFSVRLVRDIN